MRATSIFAYLIVSLAAVNLSAQTLTTLATFDYTNGADPAAPLIQGSDGDLYGTTQYGGSASNCESGYPCGTVFKITPSGTLTSLHSFDYGDGAYPVSPLVQGSDGNFYGTNQGEADSGGAGTIFKITPSGTLTVLRYPFSSPAGLVQGSDGNFYGTTPRSYTHGTVFKITPSGTLTTLYTFNGTDGDNPQAGLIQATDGNFYGTTAGGGTSNKCGGGCGTVFRVTAGGALTTLHSFDVTDGFNVVAGLVEGSDGNFYGTTVGGGAGQNGGVVFKITSSGTFTILYSLCSQSGCPDGYSPRAGLVQGSDGNFYGTTFGGGAHNQGTIFAISPSGSLSTLYSFCSRSGCADGTTPVGGVIQASDGNFYGTTYNGGDSNSGTVFRFSPPPLYLLSVDKNGTGAVTSSDDYIKCGNVCSYNYVSGTQVSLTAAPSSGWVFTSWSGCDQVNGNVCTVTMNNNHTVIATFSLVYQLSVSESGSGKVTSADGHINCGSTCSYSYTNGSVAVLTAAASSGYVFTGWTGCDSAHGNSCIVTMNNNRSVTASFTPTSSTYAVNVSTMGGGIGMVASTDGQINCQPYCSGNYSSGSTTTLTAVAGWQSNFAGWTGCDSLQGNVCTVKVSSARNVTATFGGNFAGIRFVPVTPCRLSDTRNATGTFGGPPISGNTSRNFPIRQSACGIPLAAMAYSLNVTVVPHGSLGFLTVWPAGLAQPNVSLMNSYDGRVKANAAIVPAGDAAHNEGVSIFASDTTDVVLDINGYFEAVGNNSALAFYPLAPCRVVDTRNPNGNLGGPYISGNTSREFPVLTGNCKLPQAAQAYSMNFTAVPHGPLGYLTVWPSDQQQPYVSTLNAYAGGAVANAAVVPSAKNGDISVFVSDASDVVIDVNGYFAPAAQGGLSLYPATPCRVLDTRNTSGVFSSELTAAVAGSPCTMPMTAQAYVFNATVLPQGALGFLSLWPDGQSQPVVSTLNAYDGAVTSNMAIVPTTNGLIDSFASDLTQLILDISGYFAP